MEHSSTINEGLSQKSSNLTPLELWNSTHWEFTDWDQRIIVSVILLVIFVVGVIGNGLILVAVTVSRKLSTTTNTFVVNLSVADLLTCLLLPFQVSGVLSDRGLLLPPALCGVIGGINIASAIASVITLALIAINRLVILTVGRRTYERIYSTSKIAVMMLFSWLFPLGTMVLPQVAGYGEIGYTKKYRMCLMDGDHYYAYIYEYLAAAIQLLCFIVIVTCYVLIYRFLRKRKFFMRRTSTSNTSNGGNTNASVATISQTDDQPTSQTTLQGDRPLKRRSTKLGRKMPSKREVQITRNLFYVVCGFFVCIIPYAIVVAIPNSSRVLVYMGILLCASSIMNPVIYGFNHPHFRIVFRCLLKCEVDTIPEPSPLLRALRKK